MAIQETEDCFWSGFRYVGLQSPPRMEANRARPRKSQVVIVDDNTELARFFSEILKLQWLRGRWFSPMRSRP